MFRLARVGIAAMLATAILATGAPLVGAQAGPDVKVQLTSPARLKTTQILVSTITVTNVGSETATGLSINGAVGDQFNPIAMECMDNGSMSLGSCEPNDLAPGQSVTAKFTAYVCCYGKGEVPRSPVTAGVSMDGWTDPTPNDDWVQNIVRLYGPHTK